MTAKPLALIATVALASGSFAQVWIRSYDAGLAAARAGKWAQAREEFQRAAANRADDQSKPTVLPGPVDVRKVWRDGKPYSPNFLAAYSLYRQALGTIDPAEAGRLLRTATGELETLLDKGQDSAEAYFYLDVIAIRLDDAPKRKAVADRLAKLGHRPDFKVDTEPVAPEEMAAMQAQPTNGGPALPGVPTQPGIYGPGDIGKNTLPPVIANVGPLKEKFALVVGQSTSRLSGGLLPFGVTNAERVRGALVDFAGYPADNVTLLQNASAADMRAATKAIAARLPENATVMVYYVGAATNLDGKDYLAGADTESGGDVGSMYSKSEMYNAFAQKGARIFAFFETNRPVDAAGSYFGREAIGGGSIAQVMATRPGETVTSIYRDNKPIGLFGNAFALTLANYRTNRIPIQEFFWQVFNTMKRGDTGTTGGSTRQVPTMPSYSGLATDSRF